MPSLLGLVQTAGAEVCVSLAEQPSLLLAAIARAQAGEADCRPALRLLREFLGMCCRYVAPDLRADLLGHVGQCIGPQLFACIAALLQRCTGIPPLEEEPESSSGDSSNHSSSGTAGGAGTGEDEEYSVERSAAELLVEAVPLFPAAALTHLCAAAPPPPTLSFDQDEPPPAVGEGEGASMLPAGLLLHCIRLIRRSRDGEVVETLADALRMLLDTSLLARQPPPADRDKFINMYRTSTAPFN